MVGLVVGSYQGCSEGLHALAREVVEERARTEWRRMGARSEHEALGIFVHDVHRRWGSVFWRSWARVIRGRLPAIGRPNAEILHHGPPPAYARGQAAVGGAEPCVAAGAPRHPAGAGGCAPRRACERRAAAAGWQVALAAAKFARLRTLDWTLVL